MQFNADVADGMPWKFIPTQREVLYFIMCVLYVHWIYLHGIMYMYQEPYMLPGVDM